MIKDLKEHVPKILIAAREKNKLSVSEVAEKLGLKKNAYYAYEYGTCFPSLENLLKMAEVYGYTSLDDFLQLTKNGQKYDISVRYVNAPSNIKKIVDYILNSVIV